MPNEDDLSKFEAKIFRSRRLKCTISVEVWIIDTEYWFIATSIRHGAYVYYLYIQFNYILLQVLTSKSCSEEGLEDSTKLLIRLSNANNATKQNIVKLLLSGAQQIGHTVCDHIESLLKEVCGV